MVDRCDHCVETKEESNNVVGWVKIYRYGRLFKPKPRFHYMDSSNENKRQWRTKPKGSANFDRGNLIAKIHHLLKVHRNQRQQNLFKSTRCSANIHRALQQAIRNCFEEKIFDSKLYPVGDLFLELFTCVGNLYAIFSILIGDHVSCTSHHMHNGVNILYPKHVGSDEGAAFEYYLHHVSNLRDEEYEWNNGTYLDIINSEIDQYSGQTPLSAAVQKRDPALVLSLLRYGANPFQPASVPTQTEDRVGNPVEELVDDINGLCLFKNTGFSLETREKLASEEEKAMLCLSYFRRALSSINLASSQHVITNTDSDDEEQTEVPVPKPAIPVYNLHPSVAETLDLNFFKATHSLKHLCRCKIRCRLRANRWRMSSIPKGIATLPLPKQLKDYVDLLTD